MLKEFWQQSKREQQKLIKHIGLTPGTPDQQMAQGQLQPPLGCSELPEHHVTAPVAELQAAALGDLIYLQEQG